MYIHGKVAGEEKKGKQYFRPGSKCLNPECNVIETTGGVYRKELSDPATAAKTKNLQKKRERELMKEVLIEMFQDPKFRKKPGFVEKKQK